LTERGASGFLLELVRDAAKGGMLPVLDLEPVRRSAAAVGAFAMLLDQTLKPQAAGSLEQRGTDLALLEGRDEDPLGPPAQQLRQVGLESHPLVGQRPGTTVTG